MTVSKMYIYELPFEIEKELCRLLDNDDDWKDLAGSHMKFSPFKINEIEQIAKRQAVSPTHQLFIEWGQNNHTVKALFILLYKMGHMPAINCLDPVLDNTCRDFLKNRSGSKNGARGAPTAPIDVNGNRAKVLKPSPLTASSVDLPIMVITGALPDQSSSRVIHVRTEPDDSSSVDDTASTHGIGRSRPGAMTDEFIRQHVSAIHRYTYEELKEATYNWSESHLLGRGGFGQVYKGELRHLPVAVKRLRSEEDGRNKELISEMCLNQYRHDNILPLYGYSLGGPEACLVYQLMGGGSLEQRLRCRNGYMPLTWAQRYKVAYGVSRGLQFLHTMTGTPLIHGDIKPANILLDQCAMPKIGDFGLARKGPFGEERTHLKVSRVHGTRPYLPHEYLSSRCLSPAVDVFSYGVVMIELATTLPALDRARAHPLLSVHAHELAATNVDLATLEDRMIFGTQESNPELCRAFMVIGLHCTRHARHERPTMLEVYKKLNAMNFAGKTLD